MTDEKRQKQNHKGLPEAERRRLINEMADDAEETLRYSDNPTQGEQIQQITNYIKEEVEPKLKVTLRLVFIMLLIQLGTLIWLITSD